MTGFNDYDENGFRLTRLGHRSSRVEDEAIARNLRFAWKAFADEMSDVELINLYDEFAISDDFGDNDAKFGKWLKDYLAERDAQ